MSRTGEVPWTGRDLVVVVGLNLLGLTAILLGSVWSSGRTLLADQFPATNLTVVGLIVAGAGNITWLLSGRRAVGRARVALFGPRVDNP
jgi:hypothetical protein